MQEKKSFKSILNEAIVADASEITLRVASYDWDQTPRVPNSFQAIVKFQNANIPWSVCVNSDPYTALQTALENAAKKPEPTTTKETTNNDVSRDKPRLLRKAPISRVRPRPKLTRKPT